MLPAILRIHSVVGRKKTSLVPVEHASAKANNSAKPVRATVIHCHGHSSRSELARNDMHANESAPPSIQTYGIDEAERGAANSACTLGSPWIGSSVSGGSASSAESGGGGISGGHDSVGPARSLAGCRIIDR